MALEQNGFRTDSYSDSILAYKNFRAGLSMMRKLEKNKDLTDLMRSIRPISIIPISTLGNRWRLYFMTDSCKTYAK
jgi:hypothetical protein